MKIIYKFALLLLKIKLSISNLICKSNIYDFYIINSAFFSKKDTFKKDLRLVWSSAHKEWSKVKFINNEDLDSLHNIAYNYWIRAFAASKIYSKINKNIVISFIKKIISFSILIRLIFQIILKLIFPTLIITEERYVNANEHNNKLKTYVTYFSSIWRFDQFLNDISEITIDPLKIINIKISKINLFGYLINKNKSNLYQFRIFILLYKYLFNYPFMINYFPKLYDALCIYFTKKELGSLKKKNVLVKETYSMDIRAMCIGSINCGNKIFKIKFNEDNILPYPVYSLNTATEAKLFNDYINKRSSEKNYKSPSTIKDDNNLIIVQASDSTVSSPTLYEFHCYQDIIRSLTSINYKGKIIFNFHPANSKISFYIKKLICILFKYYYSSNFDLFLYHRKGFIESFILNAGNVISIDYSQSYRYILSKSKKLINFNRNDSRLYGPIEKRYYSIGNYSDVKNYKELKEKLIYNLNLLKL